MAHILVVDDERDVVTLIKFLLENDGHRVTEAFDGEQALEKLGLGPAKADGKADLPDIVIMDVMMPKIDGYTLSKMLGEEPKMRGIPLLMLTAKNHMRDLFAVSSNIAAFIEKPFDPKKLRDMISGLLRKPS